MYCYTGRLNAPHIRPSHRKSLLGTRHAPPFPLGLFHMTFACTRFAHGNTGKWKNLPPPIPYLYTGRTLVCIVATVYAAPATYHAWDWRKADDSGQGRRRDRTLVPSFSVLSFSVRVFSQVRKGRRGRTMRKGLTLLPTFFLPVSVSSPCWFGRFFTYHPHAQCMPATLCNNLPCFSLLETSQHFLLWDRRKWEEGREEEEKKNRAFLKKGRMGLGWEDGGNMGVLSMVTMSCYYSL